MLGLTTQIKSAQNVWGCQMNEKNFEDLRKFTSRLNRRIAEASEIQMQTESTKDLFDSILDYQIFVCGFLLDILISERICPHCSDEAKK